MSFNDDTDPIPGVRVGRVAVALGGFLDAPPASLEMDRVFLATSAIEVRGLAGALTVSWSGEETIEALDGGFESEGACSFETDDERVGLAAVEVDNRFLSAGGWTFGGMREILRARGLGGGTAVFVAVDMVFLTGEEVGEGLTPEAVTLDKAGFEAPEPTT